MNLKENLKKINEKVKSAGDQEVMLIAVSKTRTPEEINDAIDAGVENIGENKVQEIISKYDMVKPVRWHMIGHLQRNKVKYIADKVDMIHSVDSYKLATEIDKRVEEKMDILIQVNLSQEASKSGLEKGDAEGLIKDISANLKKVKIRGMMTIADPSYDDEELRNFFKEAKNLFDDLKQIKGDNIDFKYLSMGMSGDYEIAISEGANIVRIGTAIFGERDYAAYRKEHGMEG